MAHLTAHIDHDSLHRNEQWSPRWIGEGRHQYVTWSEVSGGRRVEYHPGPAPDHSRRASGAGEDLARGGSCRPTRPILKSGTVPLVDRRKFPLEAKRRFKFQ